MNRFLVLICLFILHTCSPLCSSSIEEGYIGQNEGIYINYSDLVELSKTDNPSGPLLDKLNKQLNIPIVKQPPIKELKFLEKKELGKFFRIAHWNIERGFKIDEIIASFLAGEFAKSENVHSKDLVEEEKLNKTRQLIALAKSSIILLNEVDIGIPRTNYRNIVQEIATVLKMGFVYGTEFIEVDPYQLGIKKFTDEEKVYLEDQAVKQLENLQKDKFLGLHGSAILTKYPIVSSRIIRLPDCYSWFSEEDSKISAIEKIRRGTAEKVFAAKVLTELRHGGRMALVADIRLPNNQIVTVVSVHLENRCLPECRQIQIKYLLQKIKDVNNPVIIGGDFNTTGTDASPTSVKKEVFKKVKDPEFVAKQAILYLTPLGLIENLTVGVINQFRNYKDPTTKHIPVVFPNKESKLFGIFENFQFSDKKSFDLRGVSSKAYEGRNGLLSNSNERDLKGFEPTFELPRAFGVAKYKLDWFFVKPLNLKKPNNKDGSYAYAPHFGRTLKLVNDNGTEKLSDHYPIIVDIPVEEPPGVKD